MDRRIRVTGRGTVSVQPDLIRLDLTIEDKYPDYEQTVRASSEQTEQLRRTVQDAGFDPADLKTVHFGIDGAYESYQEGSEWKQRLVGYRFTHAMQLRFPNDTERLGRIFCALSGCPVPVVFSVGYTVKDPEAVKNSLLAKAVEDSRTKAELLTKAAGVTLGEIVTVEYTRGEPVLYARAMEQTALGRCDAAAEESCCKLNIEAADIDVQDTVTVVWEIK
ncbi:MAG: SIMPL domain-containing protein [Oscillospiraceae bacterium]|nr:SIMPL domain-containing protein [Oscillospiraceae bacterium]